MADQQATAPHIPPLSPDSLLISLGQLSDDQFRLLLAEVRGPEGFRAESKERRERLGAQLSLPPTRVGDLLSVLWQIYRYINPRSGKDAGKRENSVIELIGGLEYLPAIANAELLLAVTRRLQAITERAPTVESRRKINRLREGLLQNAVSFSSMVDLRPDFSDDRLRIESLVPMIQIRITTDASSKSKRHYVFQLNAERLADLESMLADVRKKLDCLGAKAEFAQMLTKAER